MHESLRGVLAQVLDRMYGGPVPNRDEVASTLALDHSGDRRGVMDGYGGRQRRAGSGRARPVSPRTGVRRRGWLRSGCRSGCISRSELRRRRRSSAARRGFVGINAMIALSVAFCLGGLAVLHAAARRLSHPTMVLVFFYTTAALFGWPFLVVAVLGLLEIWLGLRRRLAPQGVEYDG